MMDTLHDSNNYFRKEVHIGRGQSVTLFGEIRPKNVEKGA